MSTLVKTLVLFPVLIQALKLTPVQHNTQRIDLVNESRIATSALIDAIQKVEAGELPTHDAQALLEVPAIQGLHSVIRRWESMEDRLKAIIAPGSPSQVTTCVNFNHSYAHSLLHELHYQFVGAII
jgi:hypothetical protein